MSQTKVAGATTIEILRESGALLEGHFLLSSGRHSDKYFQCARLFQYPDKAAAVLAVAAEALKADIAAGKLKIEAFVGPAMGGIISAYELGRQMGLPAFYTERNDQGAMCLRRGFRVEPGQHIAIAEDVVTTGKSSEETIAVLEGLGAKVTAIACVVDRRSAEVVKAWKGLPLYPACKVEAGNWDAADCKLCKQGIPWEKPGTRKVF